MEKITAEVAGLIDYPETVCRILLHHYKWFSEQLVEKWAISQPCGSPILGSTNRKTRKSSSKNSIWWIRKRFWIRQRTIMGKSARSAIKRSVWRAWNACTSFAIVVGTHTWMNRSVVERILSLKCDEGKMLILGGKVLFSALGLNFGPCIVLEIYFLAVLSRESFSGQFWSGKSSIFGSILTGKIHFWLILFDETCFWAILVG